MDFVRRAHAELSAFLDAEAPGGGHAPSVLSGEHAHRFVPDLRNRQRLCLAFRGQARLDCKKSKVTENMRRVVFNHGRAVLRGALASGSTEQIGLDRAFIAAMPVDGPCMPRSRILFPEEVARALADEVNLQHLADGYDLHDRGLRDRREAIVVTGRRVGEVTQPCPDCGGGCSGLPLCWHGQTKVGNLNAAVYIPEHPAGYRPHRPVTTPPIHRRGPPL
ncbi:hypothetical protein ABZ656_09285 [Streptomyces sp. NPDC007095]|uniref:hypothetical protein n=1 Tax=Streptomyces sp. NPDC007095 TaxID=3154482 RepID=UPI000C715028